MVTTRTTVVALRDPSGSKNNIPGFSDDEQMAGRKWMNSFTTRLPEEADFCAKLEKHLPYGFREK